MKSTYKLLGLFWDGRKDLEIPILEYTGETQIRDYKEEYDLFDSRDYIRSVKVSELFRLDDGDKISSILDRLRFCSKVVIVLDCDIKNKNPVIRLFLSKRVSQCLKYVRDYFTQNEIELFVQSEL
ncbi:MAG: hypothetical protein HUK21_11965 [Fibrobacteraceae bacterium]|nr:hypothetical protein [Fibrobacteraceae bacterium]